MNLDDATDLDLVRAYADGTLPAPAREAFARRLATEPDLAETLAAYAGAREWPDAPVPACEVDFGRLRLGDAPGTEAVPAPRSAAPRGMRLVPLAAAAAVLVAGAAALGLGLVPAPESGPGTLALRAIPLDPLPPVAAADPVPSALGDYRPSDKRGLRLLSDLDEARAVARASRRPIVAFVFHPECPDCVHMREKGPFRDPSVAAEADPFVLVGLDVTRELSTEVQALIEVGPRVPWPFFLVLDAEGVRVGGFGGDHDADALARALHQAAGSLPSALRAASLPWDAMHRRHDELAAAEGERDAAKRFAALRRLASEDGDGPVGRRARALLGAAELAAQRALLRAGEVAAREGAARAADELDAALAAAAASPATAFEPAARDDLVRLRDRLRRGGGFPRLEAPR
jgi:hypothetical protein